MRKIVVIMLVTLLLLSSLIYSVGYGYDQLKQSGEHYRSERQAHIVELCLKRRDGPNISSICDTWNSLAIPRILNCKDEILHLRTNILERVSDL